MIVNPRDIYNRKILTGLLNPDLQIQQNWIDITVKKIFELKNPTIILNGELKEIICRVSESDRILPDRFEILPDSDGFYRLKSGKTYDIEFNEKVKIPINMNWTLVQRSSVNRCWSFFSCWVYDSWYEGKIWAILRPGLDIEIEINTRLAQFVFTFADGAELYDWRYKEWNSHAHC